jgi:adenine-specific DNA-methyltransferase
MTSHGIIYDRKHHAAVRTSEYLFNQLIPYIGNKRRLLKLIHQAIQQTSQREGAWPKCSDTA